MSVVVVIVTGLEGTHGLIVLCENGRTLNDAVRRPCRTETCDLWQSNESKTFAVLP